MHQSFEALVSGVDRSPPALPPPHHPWPHASKSYRADSRIQAQISPNPSANGRAGMARKERSVGDKLAAARATKKTKTELKQSAMEGLAMHSPRKGDDMAYWRAVHVFACVCTTILASVTTQAPTMNSIYQDVAAAEHVRKETAKDSTV